MNADAKWIKSVAKLNRADREAHAALKAALKPGRMVIWKHGEHRRLGEVIELLGFSYESARVRVKSALSGKVMDVHVWSILVELSQ